MTFVVVFVIILNRLSVFFQPVWLEWSNYSTVQGFYEQPENTIETVFLGTSVVITGIDPMRMYEEDGICAYNLGTEQQPMLASYYWLQETHRLHGESLKTVVLEVSGLRREADEAFYRKALDGMEVSSVKSNAIFAHVQDVEEYISYIVPLFSYHSRWSEIAEEDFVKADYDPEEYRRGFEASKEIYFGAAWEEEIVVPIYEDTEEIDMDIIVEDSLEYFNKIQAFCEENSLELILIKTPTVSAWSEIEHNTVENLAQQNNLTFLDFNEYSLMQEINYDHILDESDGLHMNYYGAKKLSAWLGDYLLAWPSGRCYRIRRQ